MKTEKAAPQAEDNFLVLQDTSNAAADAAGMNLDRTYLQHHRAENSAKAYAWLKKNADSLPLGDYLVVRVVGKRHLAEQKVVKRSLE